MISTTVTCACKATITVTGCGERHHILAVIRRDGWDNPDGGETILCPPCLARVA